MAAPEYFDRRSHGNSSRAVALAAALCVGFVGCAAHPVPAPRGDGEIARGPDDPVTPSSAPEVVDLVVPSPPALTGTFRGAAAPLRATPAPLLPRLASARHVEATLRTDLGVLRCELFQDRAPRTVENFVGLATGEKAWLDPKSGLWLNEPAYDGTTFHRTIAEFMIQGGDRGGTGKGEPGYVFDDEIWPGAKHDRAGLLCMANRGKNTNGAQFFITDAPANHLDGSYTIFGECAPLGVVHEIAHVRTGPGDRPLTPVVIQRVTIDLE